MLLWKIKRALKSGDAFEIKWAIADFFYSFIDPIRRFKDNTFRFFYWGWKLRKSYDWDSGYIYEMLELKLSRMLVACYQDGNHVWYPKSREYKALKECIELCKLIQHPPNPNFHNFEAEFGPGQPMRFEPCSDRKEFFSMHNDNTAFYKKQMSIAYKKDRELETAYKQRFYYLMSKWSDYWWE